MLRLLILAAVLGGGSAPAPGQWYLGGSAAYFNWSESSQPIAVVEHGMLIAFDAGYTQPAVNGFLFAYRGKLYAGAAQYGGADFFTPDVPVSSTTGYFGTTQGIQGRYRFSNALDLLVALGGEFWRRELNAKQEENYSVVYLALGAEYNTARPGWTAGARLDLPVWAQLDANFTAIGFDQNPVITLGNALGGSATLGYRFGSKWALIGYYDLFRITESSHRPVTVGGSDAGEVFQPSTQTYVLGIRAEFTR